MVYTAVFCNGVHYSTDTKKIILVARLDPSTIRMLHRLSNHLSYHWQP
jgi:hypothetical protein